MNLKRIGKKIAKELKFSGIFLIALGIFVIIIQASSTTGAVIDLTTALSRIWFFIGIGAIAVGVLMLGLEHWVNQREVIPVRDILSKINDKTIFVIDTSGIINYRLNLNKIIDSTKGKVFVPKRVRSELVKSPANAGLLHYLSVKNVKSLNLKGRIKFYRKMAREALEHSGKHKDYLKMKYIIENNEMPKGIHEDDYRQYLVDIENKINSKLYEKGLDVNPKNQLRELRRHERVSKGDLDVLTTALTLAKGKGDVRVMTGDAHISDAIERLRNRDDGALKPYLKYVNYAVREPKYARF